MPTFDVIVQGGMIVDGTRLPRYRADLGIKDGRIVKIGRLPAHEATQVIDANGGGLFTVAASPGTVGSDWSPDGSMICYVGDAAAPPIRIDLRDAEQWGALDRAQGTALLRHPDRLDGVANREVTATGQAEYRKGHIAIHGPDMNASVRADECHKAVAMLIDKLDRQIIKHKEKHGNRRGNAVRQTESE